MSRASSYEAGRKDGGLGITGFALVLAVGLVLARCMMLETLSDPQPVPGQEIVLRSSGAIVTSVLDLLAFVPAILVAGRAVFDERFKLRWPLSIGLLGLLAIWAMASVAWSADRFSAAVSAGRLLGGAAIAWAVFQCVRDWRAFRIVTAAVCGLLAVLLVHCLVYQFYELPMTRRMFEENRAQILAERGITEGTFMAEQFARKVEAGELLAFFGSPNSLAAVAAMIGVIVVASLWQRRRDGGQAAWYLPGIVLIVGMGWIIVRTQSNTAMVTPLLGLGLLVMGWKSREWMSRRRTLAFAGGVGVVLLGWAAVIGHGLAHGNLVQRSLTFRWQYWTGAAHLLRDHLLLGTGWESFRYYYLQYRLPTAPEEIRDPHNLFVRFAAELGVIGLVLAAGWLLRTAWEITHPLPALTGAEEPAPRWEAAEEPLKAIAPLIWIAVIATVVVTIASIDFTLDPVNTLREVMRRAMYGLLLLGTGVVFAAADLQRPRLERRRADVLLMGVVCGLVVFVVHNFIDFSLFEAGLFYLFVALAAAAMGIRSGETRDEGRGGVLMLACLVVTAAGFGVMVTAPVVLGEMANRRGDLLYAEKRPAQAQQEYAAAFEGSAWLANAEYLIREGTAEYAAGDRPERALATMDRAVAANPMLIQARMGRVAALAALHRGDAVVEELQRVYRLNPNDVGIRVDAAEALMQVGRKDLAREQLQAAIDNNGKLPADEPKRLPAGRIAEIEARIAVLSATQ